MFHALQKKDKGLLVKNLEYIHTVLSTLETLPFPTIAAFNGDVYSGGIEFSLACDIRVAKEAIVIAFQETRLGLIPDLGGTIRLSRLLGPANAKDLIFSCRQIGPEEAKALGIVQQIFPADGFMAHVIDYASTLVSNSPRAIEAVKKIINTTYGMDLEEALEIERDEASETILSNQCIEGIGAFFEKRAPVLYTAKRC